MKEIPKWILENLCNNDPRNPYYNKYCEEGLNDNLVVNGKCNCDNCFYGRTKLAKEIIKLGYENT